MNPVLPWVLSITTLYGLTHSLSAPMPGVSEALLSLVGCFMAWGVIALPVHAGVPGRIAA